ncbi:hypothetical protein E2C01_029717 [Portunus trituberculatus]|uniref:Uncharacterized protein n=1 Tax=Portunus trituberculatus TaxID=210409 RepID=A0A5B7ES81_PORTR|nr:hypothetical protein [Portunus trituberculatus]
MPIEKKGPDGNTLGVIRESNRESGSNGASQGQRHLARVSPGGTGSTEHLMGNTAKEARVRWCGDVTKRDEECGSRWMLEMDLSDKRKKGEPEGKFMDAVKEDKLVKGMSEEDREGLWIK